MLRHRSTAQPYRKTQTIRGSGLSAVPPNISLATMTCDAFAGRPCHRKLRQPTARPGVESATRGLARKQSQLRFRANAGTPVSYSITVDGVGIDGSTYDLFFTVEQLQ